MAFLRSAHLRSSTYALDFEVKEFSKFRSGENMKLFPNIEVSPGCVWTLKIATNSSSSCLISVENVRREIKIDLKGLKPGTMRGYVDFALLSCLESQIKNDTLLVHCTLIIHPENRQRLCVTTETNMQYVALHGGRGQSLADLALCASSYDVHLNGSSTDETMNGVNNNNPGGVGAHKLILAMRSPVFQAMFYGGMQEASSAEVLIPDIAQEVLQLLVDFAYQDACHLARLKHHAHGLLAAALKYQMVGLQVLCEEYITQSLSTANVLDVIALADLHDVAALKTAALDYIVAHREELVEDAVFWEGVSAQGVWQEVMRALMVKRL